MRLPLSDISRAAASAVAMACALSASLASAQDKPAPAKPAMNMDRGKQSPTAQPGMEKMRQQMEKIMAATDPKERQKLMQEHMQTMKENMKTMYGMDGAPMHGAGNNADKAMGQKKPGMQDDDMKKRQEMTQMRMDMMQMMMDQMVQRNEAAKRMPHE